MHADITRMALFLAADGAVRVWPLPERLGSFAFCEAPGLNPDLTVSANHAAGREGRQNPFPHSPTSPDPITPCPKLPPPPP